MKKLIIGFTIGFILGGLGMYFLMKWKEGIIKVPIKIEVPIPPIKGGTDTIYLPSPIIKEPRKIAIDSTYYKEYVKLKDTLVKDSIYKNAITIREYNTRFDEDSIYIDVYSKTRGSLLAQKVSYETKPYTIPLDTTITIKVPQKPLLYLGGGIILPTQNGSMLMSPSIAPGAIFIERDKKRAYNISFDIVNKSIQGGLYFNL